MEWHFLKIYRRERKRKGVKEMFLSVVTTNVLSMNLQVIPHKYSLNSLVYQARYQ